MGAHEQLDTEIHVEVDTTELDDLINLFRNNPIFAPAVEIAEDFKYGIGAGSREGAMIVAERLRSLQELALASHNNIASGALINSIRAEQQDPYTYLVGTTISEIYPMCIELGRREVVPVNAKVLHWFTLSGQEVFSMRSGATSPEPFVKPAFEDVKTEATDILGACIANATK